MDYDKAKNIINNDGDVECSPATSEAWCYVMEYITDLEAQVADQTETMERNRIASGNTHIEDSQSILRLEDQVAELKDELRMAYILISKTVAENVPFEVLVKLAHDSDMCADIQCIGGEFCTKQNCTIVGEA